MKRFQKIQDLIICLMNSATINFVHITKVKFTSFDLSWKSVNKYKKSHQIKIKLIIVDKNQTLYAIFNQVDIKKETVYK